MKLTKKDIGYLNNLVAKDLAMMRLAKAKEDNPLWIHARRVQQELLSIK